MTVPRRELDRAPSHPGAVVGVELEELWLSMQMSHDHWRVEHDEEALREPARVQPAA